MFAPPSPGGGSVPFQECENRIERLVAADDESSYGAFARDVHVAEIRFTRFPLILWLVKSNKVGNDLVTLAVPVDVFSGSCNNNDQHPREARGSG